jgi:hypothetical protein
MVMFPSCFESERHSQFTPAMPIATNSSVIMGASSFKQSIRSIPSSPGKIVDFSCERWLAQ